MRAEDDGQTVERIVCGVDGSQGAKRALEWAAEEAACRNATLRLVHAWMEPIIAGYPFAAGPVFESEAVEDAGREIVQHAAESVKLSHPSVTVETTVAHMSPATALLEASKDADLLVVGTRGHGGFAGLLLGSVSQQAVHHAGCPVVVVR